MAVVSECVPTAQTLVEHWPESTLVPTTREGWLPIHLYIAEYWLVPSMNLLRYLVDQQPQCLGVPDQNGNLPLHLAVAREMCSLELVEFLVEQRPLSVRHRNAEGLLPIHIAAANPDAPLGTVYVLAAKWPECIKRPRLT
jgi:ankyrin repeat protein